MSSYYFWKYDSDSSTQAQWLTVNSSSTTSVSLHFIKFTGVFETNNAVRCQFSVAQWWWNLGLCHGVGTPFWPEFAGRPTRMQNAKKAQRDNGATSTRLTLKKTLGPSVIHSMSSAQIVLEYFVKKCLKKPSVLTCVCDTPSPLINVDCSVLLVAGKFSKCNFYFNTDCGREDQWWSSYFLMFLLTLRKARVKIQSVPTILSRVVVHKIP